MGILQKVLTKKSKLIKLLHEYDIKRNLTIFDVGAHKGQTSQYFYKSFPKSNIYCFEPSPILFEELKKNTRKYDRIHQYNIGLGAKTSNLYLTCPESDLCGQIKDRKTTNCIPVKIRTIDDISLKKNINHIDLLKVDVEGYEIEVLKGCDRMFLSEKVNAVLCECDFNEDDIQHTTFFELFHYLSNKNFSFHGLFDIERYSVRYGIGFCNALFINKS